MAFLGRSCRAQTEQAASCSPGLFEKKKNIGPIRCRLLSSTPDATEQRFCVLLRVLTQSNHGFILPPDCQGKEKKLVRKKILFAFCPVLLSLYCFYNTCGWRCSCFWYFHVTQHIFIFLSLHSLVFLRKQNSANLWLLTIDKFVFANICVETANLQLRRPLVSVFHGCARLSTHINKMSQHPLGFSCAHHFGLAVYWREFLKLFSWNTDSQFLQLKLNKVTFHKTGHWTVCVSVSMTSFL